MSTSRGARSRIEYGIEAPAVVPDTTPKTLIQALSRSQQSTSIVIPVAGLGDQVKAAIARWGIHVRPWGASFLAYDRPTVIKAVLADAGIDCRVIEPITIHHATA